MDYWCATDLHKSSLTEVSGHTGVFPGAGKRQRRVPGGKKGVKEEKEVLLRVGVRTLTSGWSGSNLSLVQPLIFTSHQVMGHQNHDVPARGKQSIHFCGLILKLNSWRLFMPFNFIFLLCKMGVKNMYRVLGEIA